MSTTATSPASSSTTAGKVPVAPFARVVANGVGTNKFGKEVLRLTVLLTPDLQGAGPTETWINLSDWPGQLTQILKDGKYGSAGGPGNLGMVLQRIGRCDGNAAPTPDAMMDQGLPAYQGPAELPSLAFMDKKQRSLQNELWGSALLRGTGTWQDLADALKLSLDTKTAQTGEIANENGDATVPEAGSFGSDGQLQPSQARDEAKIDAILSVPHADLALALENQRAEELLLSLKESCGQTGTRLQAEADRVASLKPAKDDAPDPMDAHKGAETEAEIKAAKAKLQRLRKEARIKEHAELFDNLRENRARARAAFRDEFDRDPQADCTPRPHLSGEKRLNPGTAAQDTPREDAMQRAADAHAYASWPQYTAQDDKPAKENTVTPSPSDLMQRRIVQNFFAIQSDPVLSRAFALTFDAEIPFEEIGTELLEDGFVYIASELDYAISDLGGTPRPRSWSLARIERTAEGLQFWPATERELHAHLSGTNHKTELTQKNGLVVMSSGCANDPENHCPRYDLTGLDIRTATEMELQRRQSRRANAASIDTKSDANAGDATGTWDDLALGARFQSGGLTLMCRTLQQDGARKLARKQRNGGVGNVLDADDLLTGMRLMVGMPDGKGGTDWRPLMNRKVEYGRGDASEKGNGDRLERLLEAVLGTDLRADEWRRHLEATYLAIPSRLLPTGGQGVQAVLDEAIAAWDGGPMGVDCSVPAAKGVGAEDILGFGRSLTLPDDRSKPATDLPHRLRFGWPYRFALAAVYSGGGARDHFDLPDDLGKDEQVRKLYYPPRGTLASASPFFRFLRHEKLAKPQVLLPSGLANRSFGDKIAEGTPGPMGFEQGRRMIIRSLTHSASDRFADDARLKARAGPDKTQRIVIVPNLPLDDVIRHGVYDAKPPSGEPVGALSTLSAAHGKEGPIVTRTDVERGPDGRAYLKSRSTTNAPSEKLASETTSLGDGVFETGGNTKLTRYYPDPAADQIAIGLRRVGEATYLEGGPLLFDVPTGGYPDIAPLVLTLVPAQMDCRTQALHCQDIILSLTKTPTRHFDPARKGDILLNPAEGTARSFACTELTLALAPGEAFEVDIWSVPSPDRLAREFALIQSIGVLLAQKAGPALDCDDASIKTGMIQAGLPERLGNALIEELKSCDPNSLSYVGPGGIQVPTNQVLRAIARVIHNELACHPLPEIAAHVTVDAVHATNRAPKAPAWSEPTAAADALLVEHVSDKTHTPALRATRPAELSKTGEEVLDVAAPGSRNLVLDGNAKVDLNANDTVEIVAKCVFPGTSTFDDRNRGRSLEKRRTGHWPVLRDENGDVLTSGDAPVYRSAEDVFGFRLGEDGRVTHDAVDVTLLRIEGLPRQTADGTLDMRSLFEDRAPGDGRVTHRHVFPDGKARVMQVRLNALSRTAEDMATVNRVATRNDPWLSGEGRIYERGEQVPGEPVPPEAQHNLSDPVQVVLPATIRPAKCDARAPVPVFNWEEADKTAPAQGFYWLKRHSTVRVPLGREWFSSGEGERVGVVIWPPILDFQDVDKPHEVTLPTADGTTRKVRLTDTAGLPNFDDGDLGPGGAFVTRRGGDPVRGGHAATETNSALLTASDFPDLLRPKGDIARATCVPMVEMPLSDGSDVGQGQTTEKSPPLTVSLLTYEPRFDPVREEWYVDITFGPGKTAETFVRLGLVRYQPNTVPRLRCSRPVVQWTQPLPERTVRARRDAESFTVEIEGIATSKRKLPAGLDPARSKAMSHPNIRLTLFEEISNAKGQVQRRQIDFSADRPRQYLQPKMVLNRAFWEHQFKIPLDVTGDLKLLVEEIEFFRPAQYETEPLSEAATDIWRDHFTESGPRFSATIDLGNLQKLSPAHL